MAITRYQRLSAKYSTDKQALGGRNFFRRGLIVAFLALFLLTPVNRISATESQPRLFLPSRVHQGEPFFFRVTSPLPLEGARIEWLETQLWAPARKVGDQWIILVLLGAGLENESGNFPIKTSISASGATVDKISYISIVSKSYPSQRLTLPPKMVKPDAVSLARIKQEASQIRAALGRSSPVQYWWPDFTRPVPGDVSSPFGVRRIINNEKRAPHRGVDFRGKIGTPVHAWSAGNVILIGDHYFGGLSVYLDHGLGVVTSYLHLSKIKVAEGDFIAPGQIIGLVGATGRSTAPHLHFGLSIQGQWVDPMLLLDTGK